MSKAVELFVGARALMSFGPAVVVELGRHGVTVKDAVGDNHFVRADQLTVTASIAGAEYLTIVVHTQECGMIIVSDVQLWP